MKRKWLAVGISITAVVLLVLGSLTNVVGYQSVKSTTMSNSPLFSMRTQRAINKNSQGDLTSNYLGKGNELKVIIPSSDNESMLLRKTKDRLQGMDDATFTKFLENVLHWLTKQGKYKDVNVPQLIFILHQIKENPKAFERCLTNNNDDLANDDYPSVYAWFPGCILLEVIALILLFIVSFIWMILVPTAVFPSCHIETCPHLYQ